MRQQVFCSPNRTIQRDASMHQSLRSQFVHRRFSSSLHPCISSIDETYRAFAKVEHYCPLHCPKHPIANSVSARREPPVAIFAGPEHFLESRLCNSMGAAYVMPYFSWNYLAPRWGLGRSSSSSAQSPSTISFSFLSKFSRMLSSSRRTDFFSGSFSGGMVLSLKTHA